MKKINKFLTGFTLIELLVVIAIIGILTSIVLVAFPSANNKAKDSRIISAISQANKRAGEYFAVSANYTGYTMTANLENDIAAKGGYAVAVPSNTLFINANGAAYCIVSNLNTGGGGFYCADSTGVIGKTAANATCVLACRAGNSCVCPAGTKL